MKKEASEEIESLAAHNMLEPIVGNVLCSHACVHLQMNVWSLCSRYSCATLYCSYWLYTCIVEFRSWTTLAYRLCACFWFWDQDLSGLHLGLCTHNKNFRFTLDLLPHWLKLKLHLFDLLWICCGLAGAFRFVVQHLNMSPCCGFVVQLVVQQIHNKSNKWSLSYISFFVPTYSNVLALLAHEWNDKSVRYRSSLPVVHEYYSPNLHIVLVIQKSNVKEMEEQFVNIFAIDCWHYSVPLQLLFGLSKPINHGKEWR